MTVHPRRIHEQAINIITTLWGTDRQTVQRRLTRLLDTLPLHDGQPGIVDHYEQAWNNSHQPLPHTGHGKGSGHSDPTATTVMQHQTTRRRLDHAARRMDQAVAETHDALRNSQRAQPHDPEPYTPAGTTWHRNTRTSPEAEQAIKRRETRRPHPLDTPT